MRPTDIEAIADLLADGLDATGGVAEDTHRAIADRVFRAVGRVGAPVRVAHDAVAGLAYGAVRGSLRRGAASAGRLLAARVSPNAPALSGRVGSAVALGAVNGFVGDLLEERASPLAIPMEVWSRVPTSDDDQPDGPWRAARSIHAPVTLEPDAVAAAFPAASGRIAVFLHGLCETEHAWRGLPPLRDAERAEEPARPVPFPDRLEADLGHTPVLVRMNSGRHISENAADLDLLLERLTEAWPVPLQEIVLIGHSMGGLVMRAAAHRAALRETHWARAVRFVVCLGSPHTGADLELGVHLLDWALGTTPEARAFSRALRLRSAGIKDLRYGSLSEEDWLGHDPDELLGARAADVPFLPHATYYWIGAQLAPGPAGRLLGDLLVRTPSASGRGRGRRIPFDVDDGRVLTGLTHFDLLTHPDVYDQMRRWLTRPARLPAAGETS